MDEATDTTSKQDTAAMDDSQLEALLASSPATGADETATAQQTDTTVKQGDAGAGGDTSATDTTQQGDTQAAAATATDESVTMTKAQLEAMKQTIAEEQKIRGRQANEIGTLRRQLREAIEAKEKAVSEGFFEDPLKHSREVMEIERLRSNEAQLDAMQRQSEIRDTVLQTFPDFETTIPDIVQLMQADNIPINEITEFVQNPYRFPTESLMLIKLRANDFKKMNALAAQLQAVTKERDTLKGKPAELVGKIEQAIHATGKTMTAASGQGGERAVSANVSLSNLSNKQLDDIIERGAIR